MRAAPGYERALAAVLGRDAKALLGAAAGRSDGRFWTGADAPAPVAGCARARMSPTARPQLAARLALVHVADTDDGRTLGPGEWLVTRDGALRRWDGFVARGEGAAEAARLEAENRFAELDAQLARAETRLDGRRDSPDDARRRTRRPPARAGRRRARARRMRPKTSAAPCAPLDQAEAAKERDRRRALPSWTGRASEPAERGAGRGEGDIAAAKASAPPCPIPMRAAPRSEPRGRRTRRADDTPGGDGRTRRARPGACRLARAANAQRSDIAGWQARSGDAARRLAEMAAGSRRSSEERAVVAAQARGTAARDRAGRPGPRAPGRRPRRSRKRRARLRRTLRKPPTVALAAATEALATARETRAGLAARAENEDARRIEMGA